MKTESYGWFYDKFNYFHNTGVSFLARAKARFPEIGNGFLTAFHFFVYDLLHIYGYKTNAWYGIPIHCGMQKHTEESSDFMNYPGHYTFITSFYFVLHFFFLRVQRYTKI